MKNIVLAFVIFGSLPTAAHADWRANCAARENTEFPCDPDLVRSGYYTREAYYAQLPTPVRGPFTIEEINRALEWIGRPEYEQIGHSRSLDEPRETKTTSTSTITTRSK